MTHQDQWTALEGLAKAAGMTLSQNAFGDGAGAEWVRYRRASEPSTVLTLIAAARANSVGIAAGDEPSPRSESLSGEAVAWGHAYRRRSFEDGLPIEDAPWNLQIADDGFLAMLRADPDHWEVQPLYTAPSSQGGEGGA